MNKQIEGKIRLRIFATKATPSPPTGPIIGQKGLKISDFCKDFNAQTKHIKETIQLPTNVIIYSDKSYNLTINTPPISYFIKKAIELNKKNNSYSGNLISARQIYHIAVLKKQDKNISHINIKSLCKMIYGSIKSMGIKVVK